MKLPNISLLHCVLVVSALLASPFERATGTVTSDQSADPGWPRERYQNGTRLAMLVLHDDAEREYAYGPAQGLPATKVGTFTQALYDEAKKNGWTVISMKNDWKVIFPFESK